MQMEQSDGTDLSQFSSYFELHSTPPPPAATTSIALEDQEILGNSMGCIMVGPQLTQ